MSTPWVILLVFLVVVVAASTVFGVIMYQRNRQAAAGQKKVEDLLKAKEMSDAQLVDALGQPVGGPGTGGNTSPFVPAGACRCKGGGSCVCD